MTDDNAQTGQRRSSLADWLAVHRTAFQAGIWLVVGASVALGTFMWATGRLDIQNVGYLGALAVNLVGSASIFIPVPGLAVVCGAPWRKRGSTRRCWGWRAAWAPASAR